MDDPAIIMSITSMINTAEKHDLTVEVVYSFARSMSGSEFNYEDVSNAADSALSQWNI